MSTLLEVLKKEVDIPYDAIGGALRELVLGSQEAWHRFLEDTSEELSRVGWDGSGIPEDLGRNLRAISDVHESDLGRVLEGFTLDVNALVRGTEARLNHSIRANAGLIQEDFKVAFALDDLENALASESNSGSAVYSKRTAGAVEMYSQGPYRLAVHLKGDAGKRQLSFNLWVSDPNTTMVGSLGALRNRMRLNVVDSTGNSSRYQLSESSAAYALQSEIGQGPYIAALEKITPLERLRKFI